MPKPIHTSRPLKSGKYLMRIRMPTSGTPNQRSRAEEPPENDETRLQSIIESIYAAIIQYSSPSPQLPWLRHVPTAEGALCGASNPDEMLAELQRMFATEDLHAAGVLAPVSGPETQVRLHDDLAGSYRWLIAICNQKNRPVDLLTARGSLRQPGPAVLDMAQDRHFRQSLQRTKTIFLAFSLEDVILLRSLGLAAAPATGLDRLSGADLDHVLQLTNNGDKAGTQPVETYNTTVLVGWSIAQRSRAAPAGFEATIGHLQSLRIDLGAPLDSLRLWRPSQHQFDRVNFVLRNEVAERIPARFIKLAKVGSKSLVEPKKVTLNDAIEALLRAAEDRYNGAGIAAARQQYDSLFQQYFVEPLINNAAADSDPLRGAMKFTTAQLVEELHSRQIDRRIKRSTNRQLADQERDHDDMRSIQSLVDTILKVAKWYQSCTSGAASRMHRPLGPRNLY